MAAGNDHLGVGLQLHDRIEDGKAFGGAVRIGREAKVQRHHAGHLVAQRRNGAVTVTGDHHFEIVIGPLELSLQARIILDHQ